MINIVKIILLKIFSVLPDSPFSAYLEEVDMTFFQFMNWVFPLDACVQIIYVWVLCLPAVIIFLYLLEFLKEIILGLVKKVIAVLLLA